MNLKNTFLRLVRRFPGLGRKPVPDSSSQDDELMKQKMAMLGASYQDSDSN